MVEVLSDKGNRMNAIVPVRVDILDPDGREAEYSGFYGAKDGAVEINADLALNDVPGTWQIRVKELASGKTAYAYMKLISR